MVEHPYEVHLSGRQRAKKIAVLLGGESAEREVSLRSGAALVRALEARGYAVTAFDWAAQRMAEFLAAGFEVAVVALHGGAGENGEIQGFLEMAGVPYTGSGVQASALAMDKEKSKALAKSYEVKTAPWFCWSRSEAQARLASGSAHSPLPGSVVVKPCADGSSVGVSIVHDPAAFAPAVALALTGFGDVMIEGFVPGHELTVAVVNGVALGVCEICPGGEFYDYAAKYERNDTRYLIPSTRSADLERRVMAAAEFLYRVMGCHGVARVDFLAPNDEEAYFIELNTVPGLTEKSLVPKIAAARGIDFGLLAEWIVDGAACHGTGRLASPAQVSDAGEAPPAPSEVGV